MQSLETLPSSSTVIESLSNTWGMSTIIIQDELSFVLHYFKILRLIIRVVKERHEWIVEPRRVTIFPVDVILVQNNSNKI